MSGRSCFPAGRVLSDYLLNVAVTAADCPPESAFNQLNEADNVLPDTVADARLMLLFSNEIPSLPDFDHRPPAEIV